MHRPIDPATAEFMFLYTEQQRLRQALFIQQMESYRIVRCLPDGFTFTCR